MKKNISETIDIPYISRMNLRWQIWLYTFVALFVSSAWGYYAHQKINKMAVFALPQPLMQFYKTHLKYIEENASTPDKIRYINPKEAPRHYLDVEEYEAHIDSIPQYWDAAVKKYGKEKIEKSGELPWNIYLNYILLVKAFKEKNTANILKISAYLGHYIADAHVPLHTTHNHNGQLTGQEGIHAFWESTVPEYFGSQYHFFVGKAQYLSSPLNTIWNIIKESHLRVDSVLRIEKQLSKEWPDHKKYSFVRKGTQLLKKPSESYAQAYQNALNHMMEVRMRESILAVSSFWYTAWVNAGQPDLSTFPALPSDVEAPKEKDKIENAFQTMPILGREE